jgi:hypothetical protein
MKLHELTMLFITSSLVCISSCSKSDDRPPIHERIGACPNCKQEVAGTPEMWDGFDSDGHSHFGTSYEAECDCGSSLWALHLGHRSPSQFTWRVAQTNENSNKVLENIGTNAPKSQH